MRMLFLHRNYAAVRDLAHDVFKLNSGVIDVEIVVKFSEPRFDFRLHPFRQPEMQQRVRQFASNAEIVDKYETLAKKILSPAKVAALRDAVLGMEMLPDARQVLALLS